MNEAERIGDADREVVKDRLSLRLFCPKLKLRFSSTFPECCTHLHWPWPSFAFFVLSSLGFSVKILLLISLLLTCVSAICCACEIIRNIFVFQDILHVVYL